MFIIVQKKLKILNGWVRVSCLVCVVCTKRAVHVCVCVCRGVMVWSVEWSRPPESCFWALVCVLCLSLSLFLSFFLCVCVWYMTLAIWRRYHALPLQAAWKGAEKPDELKPLFNKTSESFSNTRLRCPSNWLLDFRIYMNPPKAAYLCSDAPWVGIHSPLMWISIN